MDKPIYLGCAILELSKLHMYETYYDNLQQYFGDDYTQLHYIDTDAIVLSLNTKDIIEALKNLENIFDFSNIDENHELFSSKKKNVIGQLKTDTPENIWIDEFVCLRSEMYAFKCENDIKNKLKSNPESQSKHIMFEDYKKRLDDDDYQKDCDNDITR